MSVSPLRRAQNRKAAHIRWAFEPDRAKATEPGRAAIADRFARAVDPTGELARTNPVELAKRVENLRRAYFTELGLRSAKARRARSSKP